MHIAPGPHLDLKPLAALHAAMRAWVTRMLAWLVKTLAPLKASPKAPTLLKAFIAEAELLLAQDLRAAGEDLRWLIFWHAMARLPALDPRIGARTHRPANRTRAWSRNWTMRRLTRPALRNLNRGGLTLRTARLNAYLDNIEPLIARVLARLVRSITQVLPGVPALAASNGVFVCAETGACFASAVQTADTS